MKQLILTFLLLFSVNVYAQSFLCEESNEVTVTSESSQKGNDIIETLNVNVEVNDKEIILYQKVKVFGKTTISKKVFPSKEKINLDKPKYLILEDDDLSVLTYMRNDNGLLINEIFTGTDQRYAATIVSYYKCLEKK